ncbi:MAG TPA: glutathione peroxidase [Rhodoferax sp.]|nr:glutathione peroxidase [Rhodoferax sp.]
MTTLRFLARVLWAAVLGLAAASASLAQTPPAAPVQAAAPATCPALLQHQFPRLQDDAPQNLCQYAGKVLLVVNTASYCGFTGQYQGLEAMYAKYQARGLVVLGFPSNEFGKQEPGTSREIADFCFNTYGVKFPMFAKSDVKGVERNALYSDFFKATKAEPRWNFHKFLVDRNGKVAASYASNVEPDNSNLVAALEKALNAKPQ